MTRKTASGKEIRPFPGLTAKQIENNYVDWTSQDHRDAHAVFDHLTLDLTAPTSQSYMREFHDELGFGYGTTAARAAAKRHALDAARAWRRERAEERRLAKPV